MINVLDITTGDVNAMDAAVPAIRIEKSDLGDYQSGGASESSIDRAEAITVGDLGVGDYALVLDEGNDPDGNGDVWWVSQIVAGEG